jgi:hypothetical protein
MTGSGGSDIGAGVFLLVLGLGLAFGVILVNRMPGWDVAERWLKLFDIQRAAIGMGMDASDHVWASGSIGFRRRRCSAAL